MVFPPSLPDPNNPHKPYSLSRFLAGWFTIIVPIGLFAYSQTKSFMVSIASMLAMPCYAVWQGTDGMFRYRYYFGTPPFPRNPAHGVVVVNPKPLSKEKAPEVGNYSSGCCCEGGMRWRRGGKLEKEEKAIMDKALREEPIRMLVIGDSLALGLGTDRSCMPMMPETLAKEVSKRMGGRAVLWTGYGAEGAASSWTLNELSRKARKEAAASNSANNTKRDANAVEPDGVALSDTSSDYSSDDDTTNSNNLSSGEKLAGPESGNTKGSNQKSSKKNDDPFSEWKARLKNFRQTFENDIAGPYDIVFIFSGGNDAKSAFIPFYVKTAKGEEDTSSYYKEDGRGSSLFSDFERILDHLGPKMNTDFSCDSKSKTQMPLVVFPMMPPLMIPAFQYVPLLWMATPLTGMIENNKRRLQQKYPSHVVCVDAPTSEKAGYFERQEGRIWEKRQEEDVLLCLRDVTREQCQSTIAAMTNHVQTKSKVHGKNKELRYSKEKSEITQMNAPLPKLSDLKGYKEGHGIFSVDNVHPNDEGYDFWGRFIADGVFQQVPLFSTSS
mmetsp:Transcript_20621/g.30995  ORF Transcript_20621/g.30995 Transcript_20621/m.30995 type:complete len:552 (+) Transcript_20621:204-1859(+)